MRVWRVPAGRGAGPMGLISRGLPKPRAFLHMIAKAGAAITNMTLKTSEAGPARAAAAHRRPDGPPSAGRT